MTSKMSWIFFVPFTAAAVFLKLAQTILPDGAILGLSDMLLDYAVLGCIAIVFLFSLLMCVIDRKIAQYYLPHRNIPAGIFGVLVAIVLAADGANRVYNLLSSGNIDVLEIIESVLLLLSAIVFIVMGLTHSFQNRDNKHFSLFNVMPALLCAIRMVRCFVGFTTISITLADIVILFCYIFSTLFFFNYAVAISLTEAKHAVKSCFIFGFPAVCALLAYGVSAAYTGFNLEDIFSNAGFAEMILFALYIFAFLIELTAFVKDRDHVIIADYDDQDYAEIDEKADVDENFVVTGLDDDERVPTASSYLTTADTDDYLYTVSKKPEGEDEADEYSKVSQSDREGYITEVIDRNEKDVVNDKEPKGYDDSLDEIDRIILSISEDYR